MKLSNYSKTYNPDIISRPRPVFKPSIQRINPGNEANPKNLSKLKFKIKPFYILLTLCLAGLYYFVFISTFFNIKEISVSGIQQEEYNRIFGLLESEFLNKKIFYIGKNSLNSFAASQMPYYKLISLEKIWPGKIHLELEKRNSRYILQATNGTFIIDDKFFVMDTVNSFIGHEPQISYDKELSLGSDIKDKTVTAAFSYISPKAIVNIVNDEISLALENGGKVILPKDNSIENYEELSKILQKIIQKYTIENKEINTIDLRFSKPLIKINE